MRAVALVCVLAASTAAHAYRPPAHVLLQKAMERQIDRDVRSLRVEMDTQLFDVTGEPRGMATAERWMFRAPDALRKEIDASDGMHVELRAGDKLLVQTPGQPDKAQRAPVDLFVDQLTATPPLDDERAADRFVRDLRTLGVNPEVVTFARFDGRVAYLVGSKAWETDKPQVWLDKDSLVVLRVVMIEKNAGGAPSRVDVRYLGWGSPIGGNWFPASIEVWRDGKLVKRSSVKNVEKGVAFDATLFPSR